jgi:ABC-type sugar transport system ATPase subunit
MAVQTFYDELSLKSASNALPVNLLSGGNQQKVLLTRWLLVDPDVLFLDDPTRGVDVGAKQDIYALIEELSRHGKGILLVSSELPELLRCCHRILVLKDGELRGTVNVAQTTQEEILELATRANEDTTGASACRWKPA